MTAQQQRLKIGINPISWANDDLPALGGDTPLETILREVIADEDAGRRYLRYNSHKS